MTKRVFLLKKKSGKRRKISKITCSTKLYEDDYKDLLNSVKAQSSNESEIIREIISEWYRTKRLETLGQTEGDPTVRRVYQRILEEHLDPFLEKISKIQTSLNQLISSQSLSVQTSRATTSANPIDQSAEILKEIIALRGLLVENDSILSENDQIQVDQLTQIQQRQFAIQGIVTEGYASSWTVLDFLIRHLVEVNLRAGGNPPDEVENEADGERRGLRQEGLKRVEDLETLLNLSNDLRLARLLALSSLNHKREETGDPIEGLF
jgi:hypothetical protein